MAMYLRLSERVPGWTRGPEARALIQAAYDLPADAVIVEIGSFLGSGSILLGGARKLRRSGHVHCIDPFDGSGEAFSFPMYQQILSEYGTSVPQVELVRLNLRKAGLAAWVSLHQGTAERIGRNWTMSIDLMFMDGDQSPEGVESAYQAWARWLKPGGLLVLHNSIPREYDRGHDGHFLLRKRCLAGGSYSLTEQPGTTTFLRKSTGPEHST